MARAKKNAAARRSVGEVCLYGTSDVGAGWLAKVAGSDAVLGDGEPVAGRTFTVAVWQAVEALVAAGMTQRRGDGVWVFEASGRMRAFYPLTGWPRASRFGDLAWEPAPQYVLNVDALLAASEPPA